MSWQKIVLLVLAVVLGAAGATALASGSSKAPQSFVTFQSTNISPETQASVSEGCGGGTLEPTGGGGGAKSDQFGAFSVSLATSVPVVGQNAWRVWANNRGPNSASMIAFVVCTSGYDLRQRFAEVNLPAHSSKATPARCPAGTSAVGGGVYISGSTLDLVVSTSKPWDSGDRDSKPNDGWFGRANNGSGTDQVMETWAVCSKNGRFAYVHDSSKLAPRGEALAQAQCPGKSQVVGGGTQISKAGLKTEITYTRPYDGPDGDLAIDDGWVSDATNHASRGAHTLTGWAVCAVT